MHTQWRFPNFGQHLYQAIVDPERINAYGDGDFPHLIIPITIQRWEQSTRSWVDVQIHKMVWAVGIELFLPNNTREHPVFQSGLQEHPLNFNGVTIPVNAQYLELISRNSANGGVTGGLPMRVTLLVDPQTIVEDPNFNPIMTSDIQQVFIPVAHWYQNLLPKLGYPETRLVPLLLALPSALASRSPEANTLWSQNMTELHGAIEVFRTWHFEPKDLVIRLRPIIEKTLSTWLHLWNLPFPVSGKSDEMLQALNETIRTHDLPKGIKPCNAPNGVIPVSAPNKRLCLVLTMLHDLLSLSNIESHGHTQGTYTMADAESLLYMMIGILRSLPQLWERYPTAPGSLILGGDDVTS